MPQYDSIPASTAYQMKAVQQPATPGAYIQSKSYIDRALAGEISNHIDLYHLSRDQLAEPKKREPLTVHDAAMQGIDPLYISPLKIKPKMEDVAPLRYIH